MTAFLIFLLAAFATCGAPARILSGWIAPDANPLLCREPSASAILSDRNRTTGLVWWPWGASRAARAASVGLYQESGQAAPGNRFSRNERRGQ